MHTKICKFQFRDTFSSLSKPFSTASLYILNWNGCRKLPLHFTKKRRCELEEVPHIFRLYFRNGNRQAVGFRKLKPLQNADLLKFAAIAGYSSIEDNHIKFIKTQLFHLPGVQTIYMFTKRSVYKKTFQQDTEFYEILKFHSLTLFVMSMPITWDLTFPTETFLDFPIKLWSQSPYMLVYFRIRTRRL